MDQRTFNILSLCSGGGGLDLGVDLAMGSARTVCWVEWEAFAIEFLASRMEAKCLAPAPIWTDLRTFDGKPWRGVVDCITAGYPCQPFSLAGKRKGADDSRHLWPDVKRVIGECQPGICFLENVAGHLSLGAEEVFADLQELGYSIAAGLFTAAEVGATHKRERLFIMGDSHNTGSQGWSVPECQRADQRTAWSPSSPFPPGPNGDWQGIQRHLWPSIEPTVCELADGLAVDRARWLRLFGNGVVPLQAAYAFLSLRAALRTDNSRVMLAQDEAVGAAEETSESLAA